MTKKHITFQNASGQELAGVLDLPDNPCAFALFAHCFTCGKDVKAAARISRALQARGVAVMRFDFTGLAPVRATSPTATSPPTSPTCWPPPTSCGANTRRRPC